MSMKSLNEGEILQKLTEGLSFPPLVFETTLLEQLAGDIGIDAVVKTSSEWGELTFGVEAKTRNTPRAFDAALRSAERIGSSTEYLPLIVMPYLNEGQLAQLEQLQLSGIDLSGNGIIYVPKKLLIYRTGNKNQYPDSQPTKYAYRGTTSLVARVFLAKPRYESYAEIAAEIEKRGGQVAMSTISKAIKRLESDLIVERNEDRIALLQAEKLLDKLAASYSEPKVVKSVALSLKKPLAELSALVPDNLQFCLDGQSSVSAYAVMGDGQNPVVYCSDVNRVLKVWEKQAEPSSRFVDVELRQTQEPTVYFDVQARDGLRYASAVQTYAELMSGDKRQQEAAQQVKEYILKSLQK